MIETPKYDKPKVERFGSLRELTQSRPQPLMSPLANRS